MEHKFLIHDPQDNVGVAVVDIKAGEKAIGVILEDNTRVEVEAQSDIPLGHKIALVSIDAGASVIKYGVPIGKTTQPVAKGEHVHIHNLKSERW